MTPLEMRDRLRLARTDGVGPVTYRKLLRQYSTAAEAIAELPRIAAAAGRGGSPRVPSAGDAQKEMDRVAKLGGQMLILDGPDYPPLLSLLEISPPVLTVLGDTELLAKRSVALVGARNASANGQRVAEILANELAQAGLVVVSGMARGVDAAAHRGALYARLTVAAVAGGIDVVYPPENEKLQAEVAERGAVVAEAPLGTAPQARHFPRRNRIIAALSLGVVVVEAAMRSGSLITARVAQDMDRDIFAVPGSPLDARCRGSNDLIRNGAYLTESAADVLAHLSDYPQPATPLAQMSEGASPFGPAAEAHAVRERLTELIGFSPTLVDDLVRRCQFSPAAVAAALCDLELAGRVEFLPGHQVTLAVPHGPA